eukprot:8846392-Alexandrium_andersonii.AAC.1
MQKRASCATPQEPFQSASNRVPPTALCEGSRGPSWRHSTSRTACELRWMLALGMAAVAAG